MTRIQQRQTRQRQKYHTRSQKSTTGQTRKDQKLVRSWVEASTPQAKQKGYQPPKQTQQETRIKLQTVKIIKKVAKKGKKRAKTKKRKGPSNKAQADRLRTQTKVRDMGRLPQANRRRSIIQKNRRGDPTGQPFVGRGARTEVVNLVISTRGRPLTRGVVSPFDQPPETMPQSVQDYFLGSRAIRRMAYNPDSAILEIVFQNGYHYQFFSVPINLWINFQQAQSKGRFFHDQIYGYWSGPKGSMTYHPNFQYRRLR